MKKHFLFWGFLVFFGTTIIGSIFGQVSVRSYYVCADGDDENNNGRSEDTPVKTINKALEMATAGAVKRITVIGHLTSFRARNTGTTEILITGKQNCSEEEKAVICGPGKDAWYSYDNYARCVSGNSIIRFEYIELTDGREYRGSGLQVKKGGG